MNITNTEALEILERITDGFYSLDNDWNFTYFNKEAVRLLSRSREDLIGKNVWVEFPEVVNLSLYERYHQALSDQSPTHFDMHYPPLDVWFSISVYPSDNGLSVYFYDKSIEKKIASKNAQHYQSLFGNNPNAVFSFDLKRNYLSANQAMTKLVGYSEEEILQMTYMPLITKDDLDKTNFYYEKATRGETQHYETSIIHKEGHVLHISVTNMPIIVDNKVIGVYGVAKDITAQKITEQRLVQSEKLTAVGELSASIAHEIRNPLTALKGFLQLIDVDPD